MKKRGKSISKSHRKSSGDHLNHSANRKEGRRQNKYKSTFNQRSGQRGSRGNDQRSESRYPIRRARLTDLPVAFARRESPQVIAKLKHLVILDKPAGWLTHSDGREEHLGGRPNLVTWAQERFGMPMRVHQRLDVSTSGTIAFSLDTQGDHMLKRSLKTPGAKHYLAVVEGQPDQQRGCVNIPVPMSPGKHAETQYQVLRRGSNWALLNVSPLTGRTHQIRAHCAYLGTPIRGDAKYGDPYDLRSPRALLHAHQLTIDGHTYVALPPPSFARYLVDMTDDPIQAALATRGGLVESSDEECYRLFNGDAEGFPGCRIDRYQDWLWVIQHQAQSIHQRDALLESISARGVYHLEARVDRSRGGQPRPQLLRGEVAPQPLIVQEAGVRYAVELGEHLSTGLFLDQRPQRTWLAHASQPWGRVLNTFAHAGGFSVAAAFAGAETVNIDLSAQWLSRIPHQLELNDLDPRGHSCLTGDVFDWLRRLNKRGEQFDLIILDPPSTSVGTRRKRWSAVKDYPQLVELALPLLAPGGRIMTATNHRKLTPHKFVSLISDMLPSRDGFILERVCTPGIDYPTDQPLAVKNLIWRAPS